MERKHTWNNPYNCYWYPHCCCLQQLLYFSFTPSLQKHHSTCGRKSRHLIVWWKHQLPNCSKLSNPPQVFLAINGLATVPIPVKFKGYILTCDQVRFRPAKTQRWKPLETQQNAVSVFFNRKMIFQKQDPPCSHAFTPMFRHPGNPAPHLLSHHHGFLLEFFL